MDRNSQLCWVEVEQDSELAPVSWDTLLPTPPQHRAASPHSDTGAQGLASRKPRRDLCFATYQLCGLKQPLHLSEP